MSKVELTATFVRNVACFTGARKTNYFDQRHPGFLLEVRHSGGKPFYQRYRHDRGREHQFKIGSAQVLTLSQARRRARKILAAALLGSDPQQRRQELRSISTLAQFIRLQYLPFAKASKRSWRTDETVLRVQVIPRLGHLPLDKITALAVAELLTQLGAK